MEPDVQLGIQLRHTHTRQTIHKELQMWQQANSRIIPKKISHCLKFVLAEMIHRNGASITTIPKLQFLLTSHYKHFSIESKVGIISSSWNLGIVRSMLQQLPFMLPVIRKQSICNNRAVKKVCFIDTTG